MSEHHRGAWGAREDAVWWPGPITTPEQQSLQSHHQHLLNQHHQQQLAAAAAAAAAAQQQQQQAQQQQQQQQQAQQQQQQAQAQQQQQQAQAQQQQQAQAQQQQQVQQQHNDAVARSTAAACTPHQLFSYKMASSFQNPASTTAASVSSTSPVCAARGYDYRLGGGMVNVGGATGAPGAQWWYPSAMDNAMQSMQNASAQQQSQQNQQQQAQQQQAQQQAQQVQQAQQQAQQVQQAQQQAVQQQLQQVQQQQQHQIQQLQQAHITKGRMPRAKADARPRGRMTAYAFFVQTCREEHKKKHPEENVIFAEFSKKCAERWKTMLDKEKKRFHEMAEKDKARYDTEMQNYTPPKGEKQKGKKRKQIKDPNAPKRSLSAFFWFCNDERGKVKEKNPEFGVGDIAKELGRRWSDVEPELKSKYEAMAEKDKARYDREMTAYKKRNKPNSGVPVPVPEVEDEEDEPEEEDDEEDE